MPIQRRRRKPLTPARGSLCVLAVLLTASLCGPFASGRGPDPPLRVPLESFGFLPISKQILGAGGTMFTVHYVDDRHLLATFGVHRLLKRLPDRQPEDDDRTTAAVLLELPSGHVLARTEWQLRDRAQYLWDLGGGAYLLRNGNRLSTILPLVNLKSGDAFRERPLLHTDRRIAAILVSPDRSLLTLETSPHVAVPEKTGAAAGAAGAKSESERRPPSVQINFYRLLRAPEPEHEPDVIRPVAAGSVRANGAVVLPIDGSGMIDVIDQGKQHWAFDYDEFSGKVSELSPFDSTCPPRPVLVSRSEFVAIGCRRENQRQVMGGFNLRGEEMWEQVFPESYIAPAFSLAPAAGRFALGRVLVSSALLEMSTLSPDLLTGQTVTVYSIDSGRQLLHAECGPVQRAGPNFDLTPDGLQLAVIHNEAIEIYKLPPISGAEQAALRKAAALAPATADGPVRLKRTSAGGKGRKELAETADEKQESAEDAKEENAADTAVGNNAGNVAGQTAPATAAAPAAKASVGAGESAKVPGAAAPAPSPAGDAPPETRRAKPTLYGTGTGDQAGKAKESGSDAPPQTPASDSSKKPDGDAGPK